jgi:peptidoglycan-associated lipoprotein
MKITRTLLLVAIAVALSALGACSKRQTHSSSSAPPLGTRGGEETPAESSRPSGTSATEPTVRLTMQDAFFDYDKHELRPEARAVLTGNAEYLMANPGARILIEGHCDERGTNEYNLALGDRRARAARDFLIHYGVEAARIEIVSFGEERPFAPGHDEIAWSQNRRAHFVDRK